MYYKHRLKKQKTEHSKTNKLDSINDRLLATERTEVDSLPSHVTFDLRYTLIIIEYLQSLETQGKLYIGEAIDDLQKSIEEINKKWNISI
jgi:hypothetical protein